MTHSCHGMFCINPPITHSLHKGRTSNILGGVVKFEKTKFYRPTPREKIIYRAHPGEKINLQATTWRKNKSIRYPAGKNKSTRSLLGISIRHPVLAMSYWYETSITQPRQGLHHEIRPENFYFLLFFSQSLWNLYLIYITKHCYHGNQYPQNDRYFADIPSLQIRRHSDDINFELLAVKKCILGCSGF